MVTRYLVK